jgi:hypothetical protein
MVGVIPQQPLGTIVQYYIEAEDNNGLVFQYPQNAGFAPADYYSFGIYSPQTQTLALTFEEGSGVPQDTSEYANIVTPIGTPTHSSNSMAGNYSVYLEGDSSLLEIDSPFLAATEYFIDFWFFPEDSMANRVYCRFFNRPRDASSWSNNNYQFRFDPDSRLYAAADGQYIIILDDSVEMDRWYHAQLEVRAAQPGDTSNYWAILRLADENDQVIEQKFVGFDTEVVEGFAPLRIGKAADTTPGTYPPFFKGYFDNILIYNYPAGQLPLQNISSIDDDQQAVPLVYELYQNYPNPFNPITEIRFTLPKSEKVELVIYDVLGRKVSKLIDASMSSGRHTAIWNGTDDYGNAVASGVYFYRLESKNFTQTKKMILMK